MRFSSARAASGVILCRVFRCRPRKSGNRNRSARSIATGGGGQGQGGGGQGGGGQQQGPGGQGGQNQSGGEKQNKEKEAKAVKQAQKQAKQFESKIVTIKKKIASYQTKGVVIPTGLTEAIAQADAAFVVIKAATQISDLEGAMGDLQDIGATISEELPKLEMAAQLPKILKQVEKEYTRLKKAVDTQRKKLASVALNLSSAIADMDSQVAAIRAAIDAAKSSITQGSDPSDIIQSIQDDAFGQFEEAWQLYGSLESVRAIKTTIRRIQTQIKANDSILAKLKKDGSADFDELNDLQTQLKAQLVVVNGLNGSKDIASLFDEIQALGDIQNEFESLLMQSQDDGDASNNTLGTKNNYGVPTFGPPSGLPGSAPTDLNSLKGMGDLAPFMPDAKPEPPVKPEPPTEQPPAVVNPAETFSCGTSTVPYAGGNFDADGVTRSTGGYYRTVKIGNQCWLKDNLNVGVPLTQGGYVTSGSDNGIIEKWCEGLDDAKCKENGAMYSWNEATQYSRQEGEHSICPEGWHLPNLSEFAVLSEFAKATWGNDDLALRGFGEGSNASGFSMTNTSVDSPGGFCGIGGGTPVMWTSTNSASFHAVNAETIAYGHGSVQKDKGCGYPVRCLKNEQPKR